MVDKIASMIDGIHAMAELPLDGLTPAKLKRRMTSLNSLTLLAVRFADGRSDILGDTRVELKGALDALKAAQSECWVSVGSGAMPEFDWMTVIVWDGVFDLPCSAFYDPEEDCWHQRGDGTKFAEGAVTHWRHCDAPDGIDSEGAAS